MRAGWAAVVLLLALATDGAAADARRPDAGRLVDTVVAEVAARAITLSDVALARALGVLGLEPSTEPISDAALAKYLDAQLALHEATHLAIEVTAADIDRAWEEAGGTALADRFARVGIAPGWARRLLEEDLRVTRFVELRFRSFAFVTEFDVDEALGPGQHDEATRASTRDRLRAEMIAKAVAAWQEDARQRIPIRRVPGVTGPWPTPFTLEPAGGQPRK
jgi:hypothetical protein